MTAPLAIYALAAELKAVEHHGGERTPLDIFKTLARVHAAEKVERGGRHPFQIRELGRALGLDPQVIELHLQRAESSATHAQRTVLGIYSRRSRPACRVLTENEFGQNKIIQL